jgi:hypothetical protein
MAKRPRLYQFTTDTITGMVKRKITLPIKLYRTKLLNNY